MTKIFFLLGGLAAFLMVVLLPNLSHGVPSFARQIQKPCTACHSVWPNLNQYGRQFKVKAYTDVSPEWKLEKRDGLNLLYIFPLSVRATSFLYIREDDDQAGVHKDSTRIPDQFDIFLASRVYDYAGVFAFGAWTPDDGWNLPALKMAAQYPLGQGNTIGLVVFKGPSTAADPFNSFGGRDRPLVFGGESTPNVLTHGWTFNPSDEGNMGAIIHGYFWGNRLYAAAGAERGGRSEDVSGDTLLNASQGARTAESNPIGYYFRLAWDQKLPNGAVTIGAAYNNGKQRITQLGSSFPASASPIGTPFETRAERIFADISLEQNFAEDHLVEVQALYGYGKEKNVFGSDEARRFHGFHVEGSYFFQRKYGLAAAYNYLTTRDVLASDVTGDIGQIRGWLIAVKYLPWANTKLALQYADTRTEFVGDQPAQKNKIYRLVVDLLF